MDLDTDSKNLFDNRFLDPRVGGLVSDKKEKENFLSKFKKK